MPASASRVAPGARASGAGQGDPSRRPALTYLLRVAVAMAVFYALLYFPYPPDSVRPAGM